MITPFNVGGQARTATLENVDFSSMTVLQLKKYANDNNINLNRATLKSDIISMLEHNT